MPAQYQSHYDPSRDPFGGSAHCEHIADRLSDLLGCTCSYVPSDDGLVVEFRLYDDHDGTHRSTIRAGLESPTATAWTFLG